MRETGDCLGRNASAACSGAPIQGTEGHLQTLAGPVPWIGSRWRLTDHLGAWRVRWGIGRASYRVEPGLRAIGTPSPDSPVLVTANYKLTLDVLRRELDGLDAWLLVLDTRGVNVWCSAGKGTFSAEELKRRLEATRLHLVAKTRTLILPQLAAPGVAAHEVTRTTGYQVVYGPVRARDIRAFLASGNAKTPAMARVAFGFVERMRVAPVEIALGARYLIPIVLAYVLLRWAFAHEVSLGPVVEAAPLVGAFLAGTLLFPALLPLNMFRSFAAGGALLGLPCAVLGILLLEPPSLLALTLLFLLPAVSGFLALNYTGSTTFTSLSGVRRELKVAVPALIACAGLGCLTGIAEILARALAR